VTPDTIDATVSTAARPPTKFMADLSRAMQAAAESSRDETMTRLGVDAKTVTEGIHARSAAEATSLRRQADDDIAAVREWSKAEIARIREETEARIATRKTRLDEEMDSHAATVEVRVQRVTAAVAAFETEMSDFFERLTAEQDPTRIATMAEAMPDPPELEQVAASITEPIDPVAARMAPWTGVGSGTADIERAAAPADTDDGQAATDAPTGPTTSDFEAAEAEAAALAGVADEEAAVAAVETESDAGGVVRSDGADPSVAASGGRTTTRVVVLGLVSVASIASFKRSLGRAPGVSAIGVASGPDGEFVFTVGHDSHMSLGEAIVALPGFDARIVATTATQIEVAAHDPDTAD
jgi:hypothetical protein